MTKRPITSLTQLWNPYVPGTYEDVREEHRKETCTTWAVHILAGTMGRAHQMLFRLRRLHQVSLLTGEYLIGSWDVYGEPASADDTALVIYYRSELPTAYLHGYFIATCALDAAADDVEFCVHTSADWGERLDGSPSLVQVEVHEFGDAEPVAIVEYLDPADTHKITGWQDEDDVVRLARAVGVYGDRS